MQQIHYCLYIECLAQNYQFRFVLPPLALSFPTTPKTKILNSYSYRLWSKEYMQEKQQMCRPNAWKKYMMEEKENPVYFFAIIIEHRDCVFLESDP